MVASIQRCIGIKFAGTRFTSRNAYQINAVLHSPVHTSHMVVVSGIPRLQPELVHASCIHTLSRGSAPVSLSYTRMTSRGNLRPCRSSPAMLPGWWISFESSAAAVITLKSLPDLFSDLCDSLPTLGSVFSIRRTDSSMIRVAQSWNHNRWDKSTQGQWGSRAMFRPESACCNMLYARLLTQR